MDYEVLNKKKLTSNTVVGEDILDLATLTFVDPDSYNYKIFQVTEEYIARPDLLCIDQYGTDDVTDIICKLNGISNPFELNVGMFVALPEAGLLNLFLYDNDNIETFTQSSYSNSIKPKSPTEKRAANEAIIGDKRFSIDKNNRVVIY